MEANNNITMHEPIAYYAATSKDTNNTKRAASGGIFFELAKPIIESGGVVFGCVLEDDGSCYHKSARTIKELVPMQGSKYVRSSIRGTYKECLQYLQNNTRVLFTGTPCQIADLYYYLNSRTNHDQLKNITTVDLFCHGTPPQKLFKLYLQWLSNKHKTNDGIHNFIFRSKKKGWGPDLYYYYYYKNGKKINKTGYASKDPYYSGFLKSITLQNKCYKCPYSCKQRCSDISIGDFWGIQNVDEDFFINNKKHGISALIINTNIGCSLFKQIERNIKITGSCYEQMKQCSIDASDNSISNKLQPNISKRKEIENAIRKKDSYLTFSKILKITIRPTQLLKDILSRIMPKILKRKIKSIISYRW